MDLRWDVVAWATVALLLFAAEALAPGAFMLWMGFAAVAVFLAVLAVPGIPLRCHFHNTRNTGYANAFAAVQAGVRTLDASLGGVGGCPFAPAATGNIATEDLLYLLHRSGHDTGVSLDAAIATAQWLQQALGRELPGMLMKAGGFPRAVGAAA